MQSKACFFLVFSAAWPGLAGCVAVWLPGLTLCWLAGEPALAGWLAGCLAGLELRKAWFSFVFHGFPRIFFGCATPS